MSFLSKLLERVLNRLAPPPVEASWPSDWLADVEADHEVWEPNYESDELWAARINHPAGKAIPSEMDHPLFGGTDTPTPGVSPVAGMAASAASAGNGLSLDQYIEALVDDYRAFLTDRFGK